MTLHGDNRTNVVIFMCAVKLWDRQQWKKVALI